MFVRIARFEGGKGNTEERIAGVRERMAAARQQEDAPPIQRALMLVDRAGNRGASVLFCESEDDLQRADQYMNEMTPLDDSNRSSVEMYEIVVDSDNM